MPLRSEGAATTTTPNPGTSGTCSPWSDTYSKTERSPVSTRYAENYLFSAYYLQRINARYDLLNLLIHFLVL